MPTSPLLRPMAPDSLKPRPAPQAAPSISPGLLIPNAPVQREAQLHPASFAEEKPAPADELLFPDFFLSDPDEDEDDDEPDAVPTESMPTPACVPLFDLSSLAPRRGKRKKG